MKIKINVKDLLWLHSFCNQDLTDNRGFAQIILTKIVDQIFLIGTDGNVILFYEPYDVYEYENIKDGVNYCIYLDKKGINALRNIKDTETVTIDYTDGTFYTESLPRINCFPYRRCDINFGTWLMNLPDLFKEQQNNNNTYEFNNKKLSKFAVEDKRLILSMANSRILLVKIPKKSNCFGMICSCYITEDKVNKGFENLTKKLNESEE